MCVILLINTFSSSSPDVDDRIYPRAKSRIGARYQATVPDWECTSPATSDSPSFRSKKKTDKKKLNKRSAEASPTAEPMDIDEPTETPTIPTRGGDDTVTCIYRPGILDNEQSMSF